MSVEIEYKFVLQKPEADFINDLQNLGYTVGEKKYEKTVMYDNVDQLMQVTDGRIRLRKSGDKYSLSYKKPLPKKEGEPKREIEYETIVGDFDTIDKIFETIGVKPSSSYEKYRTKIEEDGVQITIDQYPFQTFIEIEGEENKIKNIAQKLKFNLEEHIHLPADTLFNLWRKSKGLAETMHMSFDNYNK